MVAGGRPVAGGSATDSAEPRRENGAKRRSNSEGRSPDAIESEADRPTRPKSAREARRSKRERSNRSTDLAADLPEVYLFPRPLPWSAMESRHRMLEQLAASLAGGIEQPVAHRIVEHIWLLVVEGGLETGERLPTARQLAVSLNVSPRTVERAYAQLEQRGVIATRHGEGTFVSLVLPSEEDRARHRAFAALCQETVDRARKLGFGVEDLVDAMADFRGLDQANSQQEVR